MAFGISRRNRWCCLALLGLLLTGCAHDSVLTQADIRLYAGIEENSRPAGTDSLKCVSYNIEYSEKMDQALVDLTSDPSLAQPDILLLQEMDPDGVAFLASELGLNYFYYPSFIHPHHGRLFGTAVLSPWPLSEPKYIVLPYPNQLSDNHRTALAVDVEIGDRTVRAVSVHLSTLMIDIEDRLDQATIVRDSLASAAGPVVVGGDFNTSSSREEVLFRRVFRKGGFREARFQVERTATGGPLDIIGYDLKLDRIYFRDLELVATGISEGAAASDHFPVWSVFRWRE